MALGFYYILVFFDSIMMQQYIRAGEGFSENCGNDL